MARTPEEIRRAAREYARAHPMSYEERRARRGTRPGLAPTPPIDRFWRKVDRNGPVHPVLGTRCWLWRGGKSTSGYGQFGVTSRETRRAHRWLYEHVRGAIPAGMELDHLCRVRHCVNPEHLEAVTARVNTRRSLSATGVNARKTHCIHGHAFSPENTYRDARDRRQCKTCRRRLSAEHYARKRASA